MADEPMIGKAGVYPNHDAFIARSDKHLAETREWVAGLKRECSAMRGEIEERQAQRDAAEAVADAMAKNLSCLLGLPADADEEAVAMALKDAGAEGQPLFTREEVAALTRPWWNMQANITVRLKVERYRERYADDADGKRGKWQDCIDVQRQEVTGDNEAIRRLLDAIIADMDNEELDEIAKAAGL